MIHRLRGGEVDDEGREGGREGGRERERSWNGDNVLPVLSSGFDTHLPPGRSLRVPLNNTSPSFPMALRGCRV